MFGSKGEGEIALLMFEGDQNDVMRFASANSETLKALLAGEQSGEFAGRIRRIARRTPSPASSRRAARSMARRPPKS
ncbi:hypothetical protein ACRAWD_06470 [Caulobacter segnis]